MDHLDSVLTEAEQRKAAADPVRRAQHETAPIRAWAVQGEQDFVKAFARLQPRVDTARTRLIRLVRLRGRPDIDGVRLLKEIDDLREGIPNAYRETVRKIDSLTAAEVADPLYMAALRGAPMGEPFDLAKRTRPGTIASAEAVLTRLETYLEENAKAIEAGGGARARA